MYTFDNEQYYTLHGKTHYRKYAWAANDIYI